MHKNLLEKYLTLQELCTCTQAYQRYYCDRLSAACDFRIVGLECDRLGEWILEQQLPFDLLYYYGEDRPIRISHSFQHKRNIWAFTETGVTRRKLIE